MKILYAIQATGNGHLQRATEIVPILKNMADICVLASGCQADISLPFAIDYQLQGLSFIFGKKGGINFKKTIKQLNRKRIQEEIHSLPIENFDLVINDFEPISAHAARQKNIPCIAMSHQAAILNEASPKPKRKDWLSRQIMKHYAPASKSYGFHFKAYDKSIFTPVIRSAIRNLKPTNQGHYTVYLPAYGEEKLFSFFQHFPRIQWHVFSKYCHQTYQRNNVWVFPVSHEKFLDSFASCSGILCGAGFETPAEALYLGKKLMVIPMKNQFEQQCNAVALADMDIPVIKKLSNKNLSKVAEWIMAPARMPLLFEDNTADILRYVLEENNPSVFNSSTKEIRRVS